MPPVSSITASMRAVIPSVVAAAKIGGGLSKETALLIPSSREISRQPSASVSTVEAPNADSTNCDHDRAARLLLDKGRAAFLLNLVDWGADGEASRTLIAELGLERHVRWSPLMSKRKLWAAKLDAHAVIDQFGLSALGGVSFEALALGVRLISRDDGINNATFFDEPPPIMAAATAEEIAAHMEAVMDDPEDTVGIGEKGIAWVGLHHSANRIHHLQITAASARFPWSALSRELKVSGVRTVQKRGLSQMTGFDGTLTEFAACRPEPPRDR